MLYVWTIAIVIFCIIEFSTPQLVSIWFAGASVIALFAAMFGAPVWLQVTLFLLSQHWAGHYHTALIQKIFSRPPCSDEC